MTDTSIAPSRLRVHDGRVLTIDVRRWMAPADEVDEALLDEVRGPVLDVGCGPGRHVRALRARGVEALGVEISPTAVKLARKWGAPVLQRSIFEHLPRSGQWRTALVLDGSVGIGGDPVALLRRITDLLDRDGTVVVEMEPPGQRTESLTVRLETVRGPGPWFPWSIVSIDDAQQLAEATGVELLESWTAGGRWFALMGRPVRAADQGQRRV
jgi:SAM-dependent methyltransferase